jgi:hypothetical protein
MAETKWVFDEQERTGSEKPSQKRTKKRNVIQHERNRAIPSPIRCPQGKAKLQTTIPIRMLRTLRTSIYSCRFAAMSAPATNSSRPSFAFSSRSIFLCATVDFEQPQHSESESDDGQGYKPVSPVYPPHFPRTSIGRSCSNPTARPGAPVTGTLCPGNRLARRAWRVDGGHGAPERELGYFGSERARRERLALKVPIDGNSLTKRQLLRNLKPKGLKDPDFRSQGTFPARLIDCVELPWHISVPNLEGGTALSIVNAYRKKRQRRNAN